MPYRIASPLAWRVVDEQLFAITPDGMLHVVEEPPGVFAFLQLAQRETTFELLLHAWLEEFDVDQPQAEQDLREFLDELLKKKLIVQTEGPSSL